MSTRVHDVATRGFGRAADAYERSRPDYPDEALDRLIQELEVNRAATIMDLGAGTGKLTRMLVPTGARIVALEPVESMRRNLVEQVAGAAVVAGTAEAAPLANGSFDAVVCAHAFHWFDGIRALAEIHRVLKPHGRLALLWNIRDESVPWVRRMSEIIDRHRGEAPDERSGEWRRAFSATDLFGTLNQLRFPHRQQLDVEGLVERVASISYIAVLPEGLRQEVLATVRDLAAEELAGQHVFAMPYITELYWCTRA